MKPTLSLTLRQSDFDALQEKSQGNASHVLEKAFRDLVNGVVVVSQADFGSVRTSCSVDQNVANEVQRIAGELGVPVSKLARIVVEKMLQTHH